MFENGISRRDLLAVLGSGSLLAGLPSCAHLPSDQSVCSPDPRRGDRNQPLSIDAHAHVFNASDVHVKQLLTQVIVRDPKYRAIIEGLSDVLHNMLWTLTPDQAKEARALARIREALASCATPGAAGQGQVAAVARDLRQEAYRDTLLDLRNTNRSLIGRSASRRISDFDAQLEAFPADAETNFNGPAPRINRSISRGRDRSLNGVLYFVIRQGQYRCVNWIDYVRTIGTAPKRNVDLAVVHLLDFDWPLNGGNPTKTSVQQQIGLTSQITVLSQGRIHAFAPFDPMHAVMHAERRQFGRSPLRVVQDAVNAQGFIGVKIYPPMGFATYGNAEIQRQKPAFWQRTWLPDNLKSVPNLGLRLDEELAKLYDWCVREDVPIMTHTNQSMGTCDDYDELATARHWRPALRFFPSLRVNFGHFGETDPVEDQSQKSTEHYIDLMRRKGGPGENLYADSGYFSEVLNKPREMRSRLRALQAYSLKVGSAPLYDRLMFGTDWTMTSLLGHEVQAYLTRFEDVFDSLDAKRAAVSVSDRFFGWNAVSFLGLRQGEANRRRVEAFYRTNSIPTPLWMQKVDDPRYAAVTS
jgi:predicted TIM-barrel fold metal-dependent hydrolase